MTLKDVEKNWEEFAKTDPLWAIYTAKDKKGNKWGKEEFFVTGQRYIQSIMQHVESLGMNASFRKALDFGCGVGRITQALTSCCDEVHGIDISPTMIELANKYNRHGSKCQYSINNASDLKMFEDNTFDLVHTVVVLQHMKPQYAKSYIKEFLRIASPNGLIIFQEPSDIKTYKLPKEMLLRTLIRAKSMVIPKQQPVMEMNRIKRKDLIRFLQENNAEIKDIQKDQHASSQWNSYTYYVKKPLRQ